MSERIVVVTGAAKGIGAATVRAFVREGDLVVGLDIESPAESLSAELGEKAVFLRCNTASREDVEKAFTQIAGDWGTAECLINNAGIQRYGTVTETEESLWDEVMNGNLKSAYLCARSALPGMEKRGGGVVINVSSVQAFLSQARVAAYTTSKTALLGLTRSIAVDYAPRIRCMAVCPGTVDTPMLRWAIEQSPDPEEVYQECVAMHPLQRIAAPEEVADLIVYLCSSKAAFMTGQAVRIDGGLGLSIAGSAR